MIPQEDYIIKELDLQDLTESEQAAIANDIREHMEEVLLETALNNMDDSQIDSMKAELENEIFDEEKIMRIAAGIPFLHEKIESALKSEWDIIKTTYDKIK
jgi:hypothetical protein